MYVSLDTVKSFMWISTNEYDDKLQLILDWVEREIIWKRKLLKEVCEWIENPVEWQNIITIKEEYRPLNKLVELKKVNVDWTEENIEWYKLNDISIKLLVWFSWWWQLKIKWNVWYFDTIPEDYKLLVCEIVKDKFYESEQKWNIKSKKVWQLSIEFWDIKSKYKDRIKDFWNSIANWATIYIV